MANFNDVCSNIFPNKTAVLNGYTTVGVLPNGHHQTNLLGYGGVNGSGLIGGQVVPNNVSPSGFSTVLSQRFDGATYTVYTVPTTGVNP